MKKNQKTGSSRSIKLSTLAFKKVNTIRLNPGHLSFLFYILNDGKIERGMIREKVVENIKTKKRQVRVSRGGSVTTF